MIDVTKAIDEKAGSFVQYDESEILYEMQKEYEGKLEILPMDEAYRKYEFVRKNAGSLIKMDRYSRKALLERTGGYFVRVKKNAVIDRPIQTCLVLKSEIEQKPWSLVVLEEGARATVYTGCSAAAMLGEAWHIGATEFFVGKNASLNYVMLHVWPQSVEVRPRSAATVGEGGTFNSVYVVLRPGAVVQSNPTVFAEKNAKVELLSIMKGEKNSILDIGGEIHLKGEGGSGLVKSRSVAYGSASITARSKLVGYARSRGHVDCRGIMMSEKAKITAIPVIESRDSEAMLTHEASIGKIEEEQLFYLETRGFTEEKATELIVKGFLNPDIPWLSNQIKREIETLISYAARGA